jgi:hypothetical protein
MVAVSVRVTVGVVERVRVNSTVGVTVGVMVSVRVTVVVGVPVERDWAPTCRAIQPRQ